MSTVLQEQELNDLFTKLPTADIYSKTDPTIRLINFDILKRIVDTTSQIAFSKGKVEMLKDLEAVMNRPRK
jgi:hypothetical protein